VLLSLFSVTNSKQLLASSTSKRKSLVYVLVFYDALSDADYSAFNGWMILIGGLQTVVACFNVLIPKMFRKDLAKP
jgi:hypothetical protein